MENEQFHCFSTLLIARNTLHLVTTFVRYSLRGRTNILYASLLKRSSTSSRYSRTHKTYRLQYKSRFAKRFQVIYSLFVVPCPTNAVARHPENTSLRSAQTQRTKDAASSDIRLLERKLRAFAICVAISFARLGKYHVTLYVEMRFAKEGSQR